MGLTEWHGIRWQLQYTKYNTDWQGFLVFDMLLFPPNRPNCVVNRSDLVWGRFIHFFTLLLQSSAFSLNLFPLYWIELSRIGNLFDGMFTLGVKFCLTSCQITWNQYTKGIWIRIMVGLKVTRCSFISSPTGFLSHFPSTHKICFSFLFVPLRKSTFTIFK